MSSNKTPARSAATNLNLFCGLVIIVAAMWWCSQSGDAGNPPADVLGDDAPAYHQMLDMTAVAAHATATADMALENSWATRIAATATAKIDWVGTYVAKSSTN